MDAPVGSAPPYHSVHPAHGHTVIAGGSGFLGLNLARHLSTQGQGVVILSRSTPPTGPWRHAAWDARTLGPWAGVLEGAAGLVNIVGRTVDCVKTPDHCDEILRSRVEATRILGQAVRRAKAPPPVWVQMSTAHIYGDPPDARCDEGSPTGYGLAPTVGRAWEEAFAEASRTVPRSVVLRTSFVLGRSGGAMATLARLCRLGLGGAAGHGRQGMSWIHELDMNRLFERGLRDASMRGVYIASAPHPVSNAEFMRSLRRAAGGLGALGIGPPTPAFLVRIGAALVMRTDPELALYGRYVASRRLAEEGFEFRFPTLQGALADLFAKR
ncbi:MAG TPA: DUF1731 domain-containing protein [Phycisphaerales bacterium]|nr:DUF1731 domain-containing protein [Phycisphaerales bacterium]